MFRIAAFAALAGTTPKVLRDYDQAGIFRPAWLDRDTAYRGYSAAQLPELRRILALRAMGVPLDAIRRLVAEDADLVAVLRERRAALEAERAAIDRRLAAVGIELALEDGGTGGHTGAAARDVVLRELRPELVAVLGVASVDGDEDRAFYELELAIRDAGVRAPRPPGTLMPLDPADDPGTWEVFVPVRRAVPSAFTARRLPAIRAATVIHRGSYATLTRTSAALRTWITTAGLTATGPARVLYLQFGAEADLRLPQEYLVTRAADLVTELQVPVR